ncbi:hypothetical protein [Sphingomonas elodea]|nr:hypothetical protein [Sphingomonas elodea]
MRFAAFLADGRPRWMIEDDALAALVEIAVLLSVVALVQRTLG